MARPDRQTFNSIPIISFSGFDSVPSVLATLQQLEWGYFREAALFSDALGRDDRIDAVIRTRIGSLLGSELDVKASDDRAKAGRIAKLLGGTEDGPGRWDQMFPQGVLSEILRAGLLMNFAVAEVVWTVEDGVWWPRLKFWHNQFVRWDWMDMCYKLLTASGEISLPRVDENLAGNGKWFVWCPFGYQYAWLRGMIRALAQKFVMRQWTYRDFARFCEIHGLSLVKAIVPGEGGDEKVDEKFLMDVANRGNEPTIMVPQGVDGNKYDVQYVEAQARTWESFKDFKDILDTDIAVLMLGQNLTTESAGGGLGDGGAKTHNLVRLDKTREDASLVEAIRHQVLMPFARFNFGDDSLAPRPIYRVGPPEDEVEKATVLKAVGDGIASLKAASDAVEEREILEDFGIPMVSEEEAAARKAVRDEENAARLKATQAGLATGDGGGSDGGGGGSHADGNGGGDGQPTGGGTTALSAAPAGVVSRYQFAGLPIAVENPRGSIRTWTDTDGKTTGSTAMLHDYGFVEGHIGSDGEELDCYVGPFEGAGDVHVVHQLRAPDFKVHDEDKLMLGFADPASAKQAYLAHRNDGDRAFGTMSVIPIDRFKAKLQRRTGTGKIRASAAETDHTFAAIMALADRAVALRSGAATSRSKRDYPEALTDEAVALAARALAPDLAALQGDIKRARSFEELRKAIVARYRTKMDPDDLAKLVQRTRLMANLAGRLAIHKGDAA